MIWTGNALKMGKLARRICSAAHRLWGNLVLSATSPLHEEMEGISLATYIYEVSLEVLS